MLCALAIDRPVAQWVHDAQPVHKTSPATRHVLYVLKLPGVFWFTLLIAGLLAIAHPRRGPAALSLILSGVFVGLAYSLIKWAVGRQRPVRGIHPFVLHPFLGGIGGLFKPPDALCFPSGHASLAFASATCLAMWIPRWSSAFFLVASVTACERVAENAHYVSDVVAAAGLGILAGWWVASSLDRVTHANAIRLGTPSRGERIGAAPTKPPADAVART